MQVADTIRLAAEARSILSCPAQVELVVDGVPLEGDERTSMREAGAVPTFTCALDGPLSFAGAAGHEALLTIHSGLGTPGSPARRTTLRVAGSLRTIGREACTCCDEIRDLVGLDVTYALLVRSSPDGAPEERMRVPLAEFRSDVHQLNDGYLLRSAEHANLCHQEELRRAVSHRQQVRLREIVGVQLSGLTRDSVAVDWVDLDGAHRMHLDFPHPAVTTEELGMLLRHELHPGIC
ncbi:hypothetical protein [Nocardioides insulae]|uniref:hypothetical protein n=1 Tax=Nocardioides insulae TaxID=394734 RepID=UPI00041212EC|nr:hypothetical protein [Nocardioides insulae]